MFRLALVPVLLAYCLTIACTAGTSEGGRDGNESGDQKAADRHYMEVPSISRIVSDGKRLKIAATTGIIGDVLANVAGDDADLMILIPVGQNVHSFDPPPSALRTIEEADIVFVNGLGLEETLLGILDKTARGYVVPVSAGVEPLMHDEHGDDDDDHEGGDPHVWMNPDNVMIWVKNMIDVLAAADPENADSYRARGASYLQKLTAIDGEIKSRISSIPPERRKLVLDHETFSYFAEEYGLRTVGTVVPGTSDRAEPSAKEVAALVDVIRKANVNAIFVSRTASRGLQSLAGTVADEVGREVAIIPVLEGLAAAGETGDTYLGFMDYNTGQIMTGLKK